MAIQNLRLLSKDEIIRRLVRMTGPSGKCRPNEFTRCDLAKWAGMDPGDIRKHMRGKWPITDAFQIVYSQFFQLVDNGELAIEYNRSTKKKTLVRVPAPKDKPKPKLMPMIDFTTMRLKFDR